MQIKMPWCAVWVLGLATLFHAGCGGATGPVKKATFRVKGKITVDGQPPGSSLQLQCHSVAGMDEKLPTVSQSITNPDGTFEIATYEKGDGVPPGDYVLTATWLEFNTMSMSYGGKDKLNKRYSDPAKSELKFTVKDQPVDMGEIKLTTK